MSGGSGRWIGELLVWGVVFGALWVGIGWAIVWIGLWLLRGGG